MARTRKQLRLEAPPGQKAICSSAHKAALGPLEKPLVLHPRITFSRPHLPPGVLPEARTDDHSNVSEVGELLRGAARLLPDGYLVRTIQIVYASLDVTH